MEEDIQLFNQYLTLRDLSERSKKEYLEYFRRFGNIRDFNQITLNSFLIQTKNGGVARAAMKHLKEFLLENIFYFGLNEMVISKVKFPRITGSHKDMLTEFLSIEDLTKVIQTLYNTGNIQRNILMTKYQFYCGLRVSELVNIRFNDLIIDGGLSWVELLGAFSQGKHIPMVQLNIIGKRIKERRVIVPSDLVCLTCAWLMTNQALQDRTANLRLFQIGITRWQQIIARAGEQCGVKLHSHMLRHGFATWLFNDCGLDLLRVSKLLGHKDISTTQRYTHVDQKKLDDDLTQIHLKRILATQKDILEEEAPGIPVKPENGSNVP